MTYYAFGEREYTFEDMPGSYITNPGIAHETALTETSFREPNEALSNIGALALSDEVIDNVSNENIWDSLSAEKRAVAESAISAMADKFDLAPEDFILLNTRRGGKMNVTAVYAGFGVDIAKDSKMLHSERRDYERILSGSDEKFTIEASGLLLDTRAGMTWNAYQALINATKERGISIPTTDRTLNRMSAFQQTTSTLLTGTKLTDDNRIWYAFIGRNGEPVKRTLMSSKGLNYRFRPAVILP